MSSDGIGTSSFERSLGPSRGFLAGSGGFTLYAPTSYGRGVPGGNFGGGVNLWLRKRTALRLEFRDELNGPYAGIQPISFRIGVTFR
ncbi:MAG: hypothetical protein ACRD3T_16760 [Terriglobia bacterium]